MKTSTKDIAQMYQELADNSSHKNGLWKGAYEETARVCRTYPRSRAEKMLRRMALRYSSMAISSVFLGAANQLADRGCQA